MTLYRKVNRYKRARATTRSAERATTRDEVAEVVKLRVADVQEFLRQRPDLLRDVQRAERRAQGRKTILALTAEDLA